MAVFQFTYNSSGKYALVLDDSIVGQAWIYNSSSEMLAAVNQRVTYRIIPTGANYYLAGKAGLNYLTGLTQSGNVITSITWGTNPNAALTTNDINQAISIASAISMNF